MADDEKLARDILENFISREADLQLVAVCRDAFEVKNLLDNNSADILFLDIGMPEQTGLELIRQLAKPPRIILTTACKEHALEAFELQVTDYLLKPFSFERFKSAVHKIRSLSDRKEEFVDLRVDRKMVRVAVKDIQYIEAIGNYLKVHLTEKTLIVYNTIQNMKAMLPEETFRQIHRSYIVNLDRVVEYSATTVSVASVVLPVGRSFRKSIG